MESCVRGACVVTGVAARRIATAAAGVEATISWNNVGSTYCRAPRDGSYPSWQHFSPRRRSIVGLHARAHATLRPELRSADSTRSSHVDAAPPGVSDSCFVRPDADAAELFPYNQARVPTKPAAIRPGEERRAESNVR